MDCRLDNTSPVAVVGTTVGLDQALIDSIPPQAGTQILLCDAQHATNSAVIPAQAGTQLQAMKHDSILE